ncbi:MAG: hypothetical protein WCN81_07290 [Actinomycetes bacterium]
MLEVPLSPDHVKERLAASAAVRRRSAEVARERRLRRGLAAGAFLVAVVTVLTLAAFAYVVPRLRTSASSARPGVVRTQMARPSGPGS